MKAVYCALANENLVPVRSRQSVSKMASFEFRLVTAKKYPYYTRHVSFTFPLDHKRLTFMTVIVIVIVMSVVGTKRILKTLQCGTDSVGVTVYISNLKCNIGCYTSFIDS